MDHITQQDHLLDWLQKGHRIGVARLSDLALLCEISPKTLKAHQRQLAQLCVEAGEEVEQAASAYRATPEDPALLSKLMGTIEEAGYLRRSITNNLGAP